MNNAISTDFGTHVLADGNHPYLLIKFGRNESGAVTVDMTTPAVSRDEPLRVRLNGAVIAERNIPAARKPCECPDTSDWLLGGVHVRHREDCIHGEPRRYMWHYEGTLYTGSLADYARHWENLDPEAQHALSHTGDELRTWTDSYRVTITGDLGEDYWFRYRLSTGDEWVTVDIDGRD